ncbi:hypothetical protein Bca101_007373 [Brassica carinata]
MESTVVGDPNGEAYQPQLMLMPRGHVTNHGEHGPVLYSKCIHCFKTLPLASVISDSVYTTHGGLFQSSSRVYEDSTLLLDSLEELDKVDRRQVGVNDDGNITLNHVLWSCPWMADGLSESKLPAP